MKEYRIIKKRLPTPTSAYYKIQRKYLWLFWCEADHSIYMSVDDAENGVRNLLNPKREPKTSVVKYYSEADLIIDKLKGKE